MMVAPSCTMPSKILLRARMTLKVELSSHSLNFMLETTAGTTDKTEKKDLVENEHFKDLLRSAKKRNMSARSSVRKWLF